MKNEKNEHIYEAIKSLIFDKANRFKKKHGNWMVKYLPKNQVIIMDTWNGHIYQAHTPDKPLEDDGYVDCQLGGRIHSIITTDHCYLAEGIGMYKALLKAT